MSKFMKANRLHQPCASPIPARGEKGLWNWQAVIDEEA